MTEMSRPRSRRPAGELDRAHVFHSWSAQGALDPLVIAGGSGIDGLGPRRQPLPRLLQPAGQRQHRPPASGRRRARSRSRPALLATVAPGDREPRARRGRASASSTARPTASTRSSSPTAAPMPTRTPSAWRACTPGATRCSRPTARTTATPARRSSRPATGAACPNEYARGHVHFFGPYLYRSEFWATTPEEESERALRHLERVIQSEGPASIAAILLEIDPRHRRRPASRRPATSPACARWPTATASC